MQKLQHLTLIDNFTAGKYFLTARLEHLGVTACFSRGATAHEVVSALRRLADEIDANTLMATQYAVPDQARWAPEIIATTPNLADLERRNRVWAVHGGTPFPQYEIMAQSAAALAAIQAMIPQVRSTDA